MTWAAVTLGLSSLAPAALPLVRPFFPFDPRTPAETLAGASRAVTSPRWLVAHYLALIGFVLLLCVLPALHARLSAAGAQPSARRATLLSGTGIALILPTLGVELYVLPGIGRLFLEGNAAVAPLVGSIYLGGATLVMVLGLVVCRQDPQGRQARRPSCRAADHIRVGRQPQDRQGAGPDYPADTVAARGPGDRVGVLDQRGQLLRAALGFAGLAMSSYDRAL